MIVRDKHEVLRRLEEGYLRHLLVASKNVCADLSCVIILFDLLIIFFSVSAVYTHPEHMFHAVRQHFGTPHRIKSPFGNQIINYQSFFGQLIFPVRIVVVVKPLGHFGLAQIYNS